MIKMSRKAKKAMAVALTAGMLASTATTPVMAAGEGWKSNATGWWYENADGTYPASKWQKIGEKWYYFDANGYMVSGWQSINGNWYYFGAANDGAMKDGWFKDTTGKWSFAEAGNGAIYVNKWAKSGNDWYYLDANGYMQEGGWVEDKAAGTWYFVDKAGVMQTGVIKVEDKVYYLEKNGAMVVGEKTIDGVTYTFDAYGKATGDKIPTPSKAFKTDGTSVALDPEEKELSVTSVTAITKNADGDFIVTALLNKDVTADTLKDTTLTLTNGSIVATAKFDSVTGATVVYKIANASVLTPGDSSADGSYAVTSANIDVATGLTAAYEETLVGNSIQGFVYYNDGTYKFLSNATVKVGNKTVTTNEKGFYSIPATSGIATVEVSAAGFFGQTAATNVSRNYPSTQNVKLNVYNQEELFINGTILDNTNSKPVAGVKVELQKKGTDGNFTTIATANTQATGDFAFGNSASDVTDPQYANGAAQTDTDGAVKFLPTDSNKLDKDAEYQIKVSKEYNASITDDNTSSLYNAYNARTVAVALNQTQAQTNLKNVMLTPVKKLTGATLTMSWNSDITIADGATDLDVTLRDKDGSTLLKNEAAVSVNVENKKMKNSVDLLSSANFFDAVPTLPSGTYYFVVDDGTNAICVIPVTVTEGGEVAVSGEIQVATQGTVTTSVAELTYTEKVTDVYTDGTSAKVIKDDESADSGREVGVTYTLYQQVNGVNVKIIEHAKDTFTYVESPLSIKATTDLSQLEAGKTYVCTPDQNFIKAGSVTVSNKTTQSSFDKTNDVEAAANIEKLNLTLAKGAKWVDSEGQTITAPTSATITSFQIVDANTNAVVREVSGISNVDLTAEVDVTAWNKAELKGIPAGSYKAVITVDGFAPVTTDKFDLVDFQAATITAKDKTFKKIATTTLTGYVRFKDDNSVVTDDDSEKEAVVLLYDANGVVVASDVLGVSNADATYKIEDGVNTGNNTVRLTAGTYTLVVRGVGFETYVKQIQIAANETTTLNIEVDRHIGGVAKLAVRDTNNYGYGKDLYADPIYLTDAYFVDPTKYSVLDKNGILDDLDDSDVEFIGYFVTAPVLGSDVEYVTEEILSKGKYTVYVPETDYAYAKVTEISIANVNATSYKDIVTTAMSTGKTIPLTIKYNGDYQNAVNDADVVVVEDENGTVVVTAPLADTLTDGIEGDIDDVTVQVPADGTYVVKVYAEGKFVGSQKVTVQGFAKSVTVSLDDATRD